MAQMDGEIIELETQIRAAANELTLATVHGDGSRHASTMNFASDELVLDAAISIDGGKVHDLCGDDRTALTVNAPCERWNDSGTPHILPQPGMLFMITPERLGLIDYTRGFGPTGIFDLRQQDAQSV